MRRILTILLLTSPAILFAQEVKIGLFRSWDVSEICVVHSQSEYSIWGDSVKLSHLGPNNKCYFKATSGGIEIELEGGNLGKADTVYLRDDTEVGHFLINSVKPAKRPINFSGDLRLTIDADGFLTIVNLVEMEDYLSGVIESEGGGGKHLEYYKVQAILSRTYALDHMNKHRKEGFNLCARTHCQAYHHRTKIQKIKTAARSTKGMVMVSPALELASGFFHANCGGQTSESDFVWNVAVDYCRAVEDTFCTQSRQANWTKKISASAWKNFLVNEYGFPANDSILSTLTFRFDQPGRYAFFHHAQLGIPLRDLRKKFKLKSTWFSCRQEGEYIVLSGHGFGHGVGLCQEGAMRMAKLGYDYNQILNFYFTGVRVMDYYDWLFLQQDGEVEAGL